MDKIITFVLIFFNICLPCYANDNANKYTTTFNNSKAYWHSLIEQFMKENQAYFYLRGLENSEFRGIKNNLVEAGMLLQILDDDLDNDACDYRSNHSGGDLISNDPLILDLRTQKDYETSHIPTAIWIANAEEMGDSENIKKLKAKLNAHISNGGKNEIIAYCYTGHTAGLVCGVLGTLGFNIKNLMYGYSLAWDGSQKPHIPYLEAPKEDQYGNKVLYKNIPSP